MAEGVVDIQILGPVRIAGAARPFRRSAALEMAVYLAFHRGGMRQAECAVALWPDRPVAQSTVHSTSSDVRRALGLAADDRPHLPRRGALLKLGESVTTDVDRFSALASSKSEAQWLEAMRLIRGSPFSGLHHADWAVLDGTQARVESLVADTALRGAETLVLQGRPTDAEWMLRRSLLVSPYDERLYRALLCATEAQGGRARLHATMAQLVKLAGDAAQFCAPDATGCGSAGSLSVLHPQTTALYHQLLAPGPATA